MTVCIQCSMQAILRDETPPVYAETPEEHARLQHPDPVATRDRRRELERALAEKMNLKPREGP